MARTIETSGNFSPLLERISLSMKGMDTWKARLNEIAIGPMKARRAPDGKQSSVTITLLARPDKPIDVENVEIQVHFYDKLTSGEIKRHS